MMVANPSMQLKGFKFSLISAKKMIKEKCRNENLSNATTFCLQPNNTCQKHQFKKDNCNINSNTFFANLRNDP